MVKVVKNHDSFSSQKLFLLKFFPNELKKQQYLKLYWVRFKLQNVKIFKNKLLNLQLQNEIYLYFDLHNDIVMNKIFGKQIHIPFWFALE